MRTIATVARLGCVTAVLLSAHAWADTLTGRIIGVLDGDTVIVLDETNAQHRIRLVAVDAPEKGQPFGDRSRQSLRETASGKLVDVRFDTRDKYGRIVGTVLIASPDCKRSDCPRSVDVGLTQISHGMAWHFKRYEREQSAEDRVAYSRAEQEARAARRGLWSEKNPVPPWEWRNRMKPR